MKKLLALVLALVMTLGLATVSSNAAFADADSIEHDEAVDVLNALGVVSGKENNNFDPTGDVKRSEMAKMVAMAMLGNVDASAFTGAKTDLTDIDGHWAEGYIKFCVSQGIVGGRGNGKFDPDANVTTAEAAKMLLVALGYNSTIRGYTGDQWTVNVIRDAQMKGLLDDLSGLSSGKALNRDESAQMIYNTLEAHRVVAVETINSDGTISTQYRDATAAEGTTLLAKTFSGKESVDVQLQNVKYETSGPNKGTYTLTFSANVVTSASAAGGTVTVIKVDKDYSDLLGQTVNVLWKDKTTGTAENYDAEEVVFGVTAKYDNAATATLPHAAWERDGDKGVKALGTSYKLDNVNTVYWQYDVEGARTAPGNLTTYNLDSTTSYDTFRLVDTDNSGKYDLILRFVNTPVKVSYVDSSKIIAGAKTYAKADYEIDESIAKDDYAAISWNFATGLTKLAEIEKQSGKVTATKGTAGTDQKVQFDGASTWLGDAGATALGESGGTAMVIDNTYDYWMLSGIVYANKLNATTSKGNVVFVSNVESGLNGTQAKIWKLDGTSETVKVDTGNSGAYVPAAVANNNVNAFYTAVEASSGYRFTAATTGKGTMLANYTYSALTAADAADSQTGTIDDLDSIGIEDSATVFVYNTKNGTPAAIAATNYTVKVITGKQLKTLAAAANTAGNILLNDGAYLYHKVDGLNKVTYAAVQWMSTTTNWDNWATPTGVSANFALVTSAPVAVSDGLSYSVWTGSENVTVLDKDNTTLGTVNKFSLVGYKSIVDGVIKDVDVYKMDNSKYAAGTDEYAPVAITGFSKSANGYTLYTHDNGTAIATDADTIWMYVNSGASNADDIGVTTAVDLKVADQVYGEDVRNAIVYTRTAGTASVVILDVSNQLTKDASEQKVVSLDAAYAGKVLDGDDNIVKNGDKVKVGDLLTVTTQTRLDTYGAKTATGTPAVVTNGTDASYVLVVTDDDNVAIAQGAVLTLAAGATSAHNGLTFTATPVTTGVKSGEYAKFKITWTGTATSAATDSVITFSTNVTSISKDGTTAGEYSATPISLTGEVSDNSTAQITAAMKVTFDPDTTGPDGYFYIYLKMTGNTPTLAAAAT